LRGEGTAKVCITAFSPLNVFPSFLHFALSLSDEMLKLPALLRGKRQKAEWGDERAGSGL